MTSRAQVAAHVAALLPTDRSGAVHAAAAWLVSTGRSGQSGYLARDVAQALAARGYLTASVTTARPLSAGARERLEAFIREATGADRLELETQVDPKLIGGAIIETPDAQLDASIRTKLAKFVQGVTHE